MRLFLIALLVLVACGGDDTTDASGTTTSTSAPEDACSTEGLRIELVAQADLPQPVADMRRRIFEAAMACDIEGVAALANAGDSSFKASFGGGEVPELWQTGGDPLDVLVRVLNMSSARAEGDVYVWPAAFARESWDEVTPAERDEVATLSDVNGHTDYAEFGGYIGFRAGITADGDWIFFVIGD